MKSPAEKERAEKLKKLALKKQNCTHPVVKEYQGGQVEKCVSCGKTWS